jgi:hypothetical protein
MNPNKTIFPFAGLLLATTLALPVYANDPPAAGTCAAGQGNLVRIIKADRQDEARKVDQGGNNDQYVCEKKTAEGSKYRDNDRPKDDKGGDKGGGKSG